MSNTPMTFDPKEYYDQEYKTCSEYTTERLTQAVDSLNVLIRESMELTKSLHFLTPILISHTVITNILHRRK